MNTNLAKNTVLLSIGNFLTKGINLMMIPLFSSWLTTEDYGTFDLYCTYVALLIPFISLSSSDAIFRFSVEKKAKEDKAIYITSGLLINIVIGSLVTILLCLFSWLTNWHLFFPFILLLWGELGNVHLQGFLRAIKRLDVFSIASVINTIIIAVMVTVFIIEFELGLEGILFGYACGFFVSNVIIILMTGYVSYIDIGKIDKQTITEMNKYAAPLIPNNICWWIINVSDRTIINTFLGAAANGIYAIAYKIPNFCASVFNSFNISWQETAVEIIYSKERDEYLNNLYNTTISTMISFCCCILAVNFILFEYIFDERYYEAYLYSPILTTSIILNSLVQFFGGIQIGLRRTKENGISTFLGAISNVVVNLILIGKIGIYAAAISTLFANILICVIRYFRLRRDFVFTIKANVRCHLFFYIYMFISCYVAGLILTLINLLLSLVFFFYINKNYINKVVNRIYILIR